jgi:hypothetical protein
LSGARSGGCGGYGGLVNIDGVVWSATAGSGVVLRWDPSQPDSGTNPQCIPLSGNYGMARDSAGNVWVSTYGGYMVVYKVSMDGNTVLTFPSPNYHTQGLAVDGNDHVWLSSSLSAGPNSIVHLLNDGTYVGSVTGAGSGSTGISVDAAGKIWTANYESSDATRIDPALGPVGGGGATIGAFDLTVSLPGASPYNYSDMTGSALTGKPQFGTWTVVYDSGSSGTDWESVSWNHLTPAGASLTVTAATSEDGSTYGPAQPVTNGASLAIPSGRYIMVSVVFTRSAIDDASPVLYDLTVRMPADLPPTGAATGAASLVALTFVLLGACLLTVRARVTPPS